MQYLSVPNWAPPHTRGWTQHERAERWLSDGSPAHAGMDPHEENHRRGCGRLPRTRGDGPRLVVWYDAINMAPPHTRGWTPATARGASRLVGSPAHAGMDPAPLGPRASWPWLPRTRGDGPEQALAMGSATKAPPHTRGWTSFRRRDLSSAPGSPAHAGMDPMGLARTLSSPWLPRTRGDGPLARVLRMRARWAPPHTRGWTVLRSLADFPFGGSPAHAGMDPRRWLARRRCSRLPRTRGDGPQFSHVSRIAVRAPPHTRGWTR